MADSRKYPDLPGPLENLARGLLATTCLTVACGTGAVAGTVTEPIGAFPNSSPGYLLPVGTTIVNGFAGEQPSEAGFDSPDWFEFQGLTPGDTYTLTAVYDPLGPRPTTGNGESGLSISLFTSSQTPLFTAYSMEGAGVSGANALMGIVPSDGRLDVEMTAEAGEGGSQPIVGELRSQQLRSQQAVEGGSYYQVTLSQSAIPEPGTLATAGLALAGALAWRRKRRQ